jgi:glycine hydroxymethyltransferase
MSETKGHCVEDHTILNLMKNERERQKRSLELIASENFTSSGVMKVLGSCFTNKYSEGLPGKRYYGGNQFIDQMELLCQQRAREAYRLSPDDWHVNCQSLSGSPANFQVMTGLLQPGDVIMGLDLPCGGHLSHGYMVGDKKLTAPAIFFTSRSYQTNLETGLLDYDLIRERVLEHRPKLLICGGSAYPRDWDYFKFREMADLVGAYLLCDMAHISGIVMAGERANNPFEYCDVVTTTTHKTMRGPRGALIFCRKNLAKTINSAVFPCSQGGPHNNAMAGIATALHEGMQPEFKEYIDQVLSNSQTLADELMGLGYKLVTGGTENHLLLWDLRDVGLTGSKMEKLCDFVEITLNKNTVPGDKSAMSPGGVRIGTPAMTTRGFKEPEMIRLAELLDRIVNKGLEIQKISGKKLVDFVKAMHEDPELSQIKKEVNDWVSTYFMPGH